MTVKERDEHLLDLLKDIISSSDANCGDSLANAICAAKDVVYSEGDKPTERTLNDTDISALTGADLLAIVEARKEDFIVYVGIQNKTCLSPDISHVTMNGQAIQINLETALLDNLSDEPWIKEAFQT